MTRVLTALALAAGLMAPVAAAAQTPAPAAASLKNPASLNEKAPATGCFSSGSFTNSS